MSHTRWVDEVAARICGAHADTTDLVPFGEDWAMVRGVPCQHVPLPYPWGRPPVQRRAVPPRTAEHPRHTRYAVLGSRVNQREAFWDWRLRGFTDTSTGLPAKSNSSRSLRSTKRT